MRAFNFQRLSFLGGHQVDDVGRSAYQTEVVFSFQIHFVQELGDKVVRRNCISEFQKSICQSRLSMVNMGDNGKVPDAVMLFYLFHMKIDKLK